MASDMDIFTSFWYTMIDVFVYLVSTPPIVFLFSMVLSCFVFKALGYIMWKGGKL